MSGNRGSQDVSKSKVVTHQETSVTGAQHSHKSRAATSHNEEDIETEDEAEQTGANRQEQRQQIAAQEWMPTEICVGQTALKTDSPDVEHILEGEHDLNLRDLCGRDLQNDQPAPDSLSRANELPTGCFPEPRFLPVNDDAFQKQKVAPYDLDPRYAAEANDYNVGPRLTGIVAENVMEVQSNEENERTRKVTDSLHAIERPSFTPTPPNTTQMSKRSRSTSDKDTTTVISREAKRLKTQIQTLSSPKSDGSSTSATDNNAQYASGSSSELHGSHKGHAPPTEQGPHENVKHLSEGRDGKTAIRPTHAKNSRSRLLKVVSEAHTHPVKVKAESAFSTPSQDKYRVAVTNSSITDRRDMMKFLNAHCKIHEKVSGTTDILCVGKVSTTSKLLLAVVMGITIVSDEWISDSAKEGKMLDPDDFLVRDDEFKKRYGRYLADVPSSTATDVFSNRLIYITPALKKQYGGGFEDIKNICVAAGAKNVISQPARHLLKSGDEAAVIGLEQGDLDAMALYDNGHKVFAKDFLSHSILSGKMRWGDTFMITPGVSKNGSDV